MKFLLLAAALFFPGFASAEPVEEAAKTLQTRIVGKCGAGVVEFKREWKSAEAEYRDQSQKLPKAKLQELVSLEQDQDGESYFLELGRSYFPASLPEAYKARGTYLECGERLQLLVSNLESKKDAIVLRKQWNVCVRGLYTGYFPTLAKRFHESLLHCLEKLK